MPDRIYQALRLANCYGANDGCHHKEWLIDQMVRALTGEDYRKWVQDFCNGEDGPDTYTWPVGIPP